MDQTHSRAREALQPFVHLANSTDTSSPRLIANLITNATSNPQTFFFAELLETPTVQSLRSPGTPDEYQSYLTLLEIFSWGTWQEYQCKAPPSTSCGYPSPLTTTSNSKSPGPQLRTNSETPPSFPPVSFRNRKAPHLRNRHDRSLHLQSRRPRVPRHNRHLLLAHHRTPLPGILPTHSNRNLRRSPTRCETAVHPTYDIRPSRLGDPLRRRNQRHRSRDRQY